MLPRDRSASGTAPGSSPVFSPRSHLAHPKYRADIDGLRAVAVLSVVGYHAFPGWIAGGFLGVDIFFVISGFLISTIIFGSLERNSFSFAEFYARRVRRIFPALISVLFFCFVFGWFALLPGEYAQLGRHMTGAAAFASNFVLWNESGYFDAGAETKPLLHLWSLGIEEQFYMIYPLLLWLIWKRGINALTIVVIVTLASFGLNLRQYVSHPVAAFYSPHTRFWELTTGSILAYLSLRHSPTLEAIARRLDRWLRRILYAHPEAPVGSRPSDSVMLHGVLSVTGLLLLGTGFVLVSREDAFPGWWALVPTVGAVLLIAAGAQAPVNRWILTNRVLVWFGLISFPLYLWHWVFLSFARILEAQVPSRPIRIGAVALSVLAAWLTYALIERPLRFGSHGRLKTAMLIVIMIGIGGAGYVTNAKEGFPFRFAVRKIAFSGTGVQSDPGCAEKFGAAFAQYCLIEDITRDPDLVVIGDSTAQNLAMGLTRQHTDRNRLMLGRAGCPPLLGVTTRLVEGEMQCEQVIEPAVRYASSTPSVKTVVLGMLGPGYVNKRRSLLHGGFIDLHSSLDSVPTEPAVLFRVGLRRTLKTLTDAGKQVIFVVSAPRLDFEPIRCVDVRPFRLGTKPACSVSKTQFDEDQREYRRAVFELLPEFPQVKVFDLAAELCDNQYCYAEKDGLILYADEVHISVLGAEYMMSRLLSRIRLE